MHFTNRLASLQTDKNLQTDYDIYIGETQRHFFKRAGEHRGYVNRNETNQPTGHHFILTGHQTSDMTCIVIEQVLPANDPFLRKRREKFWINKYQSVEHG